MKEQSYLGLLAVVSGGRLGDDDTHLEGYWTHREDFKCAEGNVSLAGMMLEMSHHIVLRAKAAVSKIEIRQTAPFVTVTWQDSTRRVQSGAFDNVILAVPPSVWNKITVTPPVPAGNEMGLGPAVKYVSHVQNRFWIRSGSAPNGFSDELGQTWESTENQVVASNGTAMTVFAGGAFVPASDAKKHFQAQILKLYPGYRVLDDYYADWPKTNWIQTGYSCPKVGQVTTIGKFLSLPHASRLFFAGEHTCLAYFGYMEGALQSGARAAKAVLAGCLKRSTAPVEEEVVADMRYEEQTSFLEQLIRDLGYGTTVSDSFASESIEPLVYGPRVDRGTGSATRPAVGELLNVIATDLQEDLSYEQIVERIRQELSLPFTDPDDPQLYERRRRLRELFTSIPQSRARELHAQLGSRPTGDTLSRQFHLRLATPTRREFLKFWRVDSLRRPPSHPRRRVPPHRHQHRLRANGRWVPCVRYDAGNAASSLSFMTRTNLISKVSACSSGRSFFRAWWLIRWTRSSAWLWNGTTQSRFKTISVFHAPSTRVPCVI
jgi:hypothetical protein